MSNWSFMSNFTNLSGMLSGDWGDGDSNPLEDGDSDPVETELCSMDKPLGGLADDDFDSTQYRNGLPDTPPLRAMSPETQYELNETGDHVEDRLKDSVTSVGSDKDDKGGVQENMDVDEDGGNQGDDKGCIFVVNDEPLQFFIPPSKEKKALRELIQKAGGKVVRRPTKEVFYILPTGEKMLPGVQHVLRADYVYECVKANKLLNVYKYRGSEPVDTMLPADSPMDTQDSSMNAPDGKAAVTNTSGSESVDAGESRNDTADKTGANASTPSSAPDVSDKDVYGPLDECLKELGTKQNKDLWVTLDIKIKTPDQEIAKAGEAEEVCLREVIQSRYILMNDVVFVCDLQ